MSTPEDDIAALRQWAAKLDPTIGSLVPNHMLLDLLARWEEIREAALREAAKAVRNATYDLIRSGPATDAERAVLALIPPKDPST